jgi:hypothetical protein
MTNLYSIKNLVDEIDEHPLRWDVITLESALSLPTLSQKDGNIFVEFFFYPIGGPMGQRSIWPPYYRVSSPVGSEYNVNFIPIEPEELGSISAEEPLGDEVLSNTSRDAYDAQVQTLYNRLEQILDFYPKQISEISGTEKLLVSECRTLFYSLAEEPVMPAYRALNPTFFDWLDNVANNAIS